MKITYQILKLAHPLKDPVFQPVLQRVAEWANKQGLENKKCHNFRILGAGSDDPLNIATWITCDIEDKE